jgi:AraC family transcriptional regulator
MEHVVEHVLSTMRERLDEELTLDDLAKTANFSKFYFARMFRRVTGVSPRRYLYTLRLQEAKRLLTATSFSVAEISYRVGYRSVGTFSSRFAASVGVPPARYRRLGGDVSRSAGQAHDAEEGGEQSWPLSPHDETVRKCDTCLAESADQHQVQRRWLDQ